MSVSLLGTKVPTIQLNNISWCSRPGITQDLLPTIQTVEAITINAMMAPLDNVIDPESLPAAPASLSPLPAEEPASPAVGPVQVLALLPTEDYLTGVKSPLPGC